MNDKLESPRRKRKNSITVLDLLTYDTLLCVFSYLTPRELANLALVSKETKILSETDWLWRPFFGELRQNYIDKLQLSNLYELEYKISNFKCTHGTAKRFFIQESDFINRLSPFIGLWSEKWCDVDVQNSTKISYNGKDICVEYTKNKFAASFNSFLENNLVFTLNGGDSGWSFVYTLSCPVDRSKPLQITSGIENTTTTFSQYNQSPATDSMGNFSKQSLQLHVYRDHDKVEFNGVFIQKKSCPPSPTNNSFVYSTFIPPINNTNNINSTVPNPPPQTTSSNPTTLPPVVSNTNTNPNNDNNNNNSNNNTTFSNSIYSASRSRNSKVY
ncbi:cyclin-like F-box containing protein [Tieghemostelium lacteum]|uniref:Cyclin-like F-box containing protein n=1 Tax=Tieghemostelium lacteum TaxID=361077 RepID=A0A151Z7A8_TIELA|nr:cyclin-like F-box containing protein [Tieghemostelium lacteum]|eukprot:KYQ89674.1 cyclin-like F-box containing protein [Tieghemostelium lacteum]